MKLVYNIDDTWKKQSLRSANTKWRQWKSTLYTKYIVPYESMPEMLYNPPPNERIHREDWKDFVIIRMSEASRKKSQELKDRRAKNLYPHHISRKGYSGLREEMKDQLTGNPQMDRALLWKKARENKEGVFDGEMLTKAVMRIDDYIRKKEEGVLCESGSDDILTQALETPEHSGRVRGAGVGVTPTLYFNLSKGTRAGVGNVVQEMKREFVKQMAEMNAKILELQQQMMKKEIEAKDSCSVKNEMVDGVDEVEEVLRDNVPVVKVRKNKEKSHPRKPAKLEAINVPKQLKNLHKYARHALTGGMSIQIQVDNDVFGHEHIIYLFFDDIHHMCALEAIAASCICTYIWHLYKECEGANLLHRVRFVNPYKISHNPNVDPQEKANIIQERMIGTLPNQFIFVPCNVGYVPCNVGYLAIPSQCLHFLAEDFIQEKKLMKSVQSGLILLMNLLNDDGDGSHFDG